MSETEMTTDEREERLRNLRIVGVEPIGAMTFEETLNKLLDCAEIGLEGAEHYTEAEYNTVHDLAGKLREFTTENRAGALQLLLGWTGKEKNPNPPVGI